MSWINRALVPVVAITLSSFFGVTLVEIGLRLANNDNPWIKTEEANILRNFQFSYDASYFYESDFSSVDYVRDEYALRDACESPNEIDVLTIGGSTTDQRYVPFDFTYQAVLEERLSKAVDGFGCVSNAGVDGHSTWGHIFSFEYWFPLIPELNPKFIVLYVGVNDANFLRAIKPNPGDNNKQESGVKAFLKDFYLVKALLPVHRFLKQLNDPLLVYGGHAPLQLNADDYDVMVMNERTISLSKDNAKAFKSRMSKLLYEIRALNAIPICVTQPHRYTIKKNGQTYGIADVLGTGFSGIDYDYSIRQLNSVMLELCRENTLDLYSHKFVRSHFYDGAHTTASGSKEIGERLADFMIAKFF